MNKQETIQVITLLAGNYNSIAEKDKTQKQLMINTWLECLGDLDYRLVLEMIKPTTSKTAIEAWNEAYSMICKGTYMEEEEFEKASPEVKKFFGNVRQVRELAQTNTDVVNSVTKGQFLKQYEVIVNREKEQKLLPQSMQDFTKKLAERMDIKQIGE